MRYRKEILNSNGIKGYNPIDFRSGLRDVGMALADGAYFTPLTAQRR